MTVNENHSEMIHHLTLVGHLADDAKQITQELHIAVGCARDKGATWRLLGAVLGTSTQAAWERFRTQEASPSGADIEGVMTGTLRLWEDDEVFD